MKNAFCPRPLSHGTAPLTFVISTGAKRSGEISVLTPFLGMFSTERTRISYDAALDKTAYAPFFKERRMMFANATNVYRKSGVAQWRDLRFLPSVHTKSRV
jgi:hypothetical protein